MGYLMLLRHGESEWNLDNCFTRWIDVPLSIQGQEEAVAAAKQLTGYRFDQALTSRLVRATDTLRIVLAAIGQEKIPIEENQALNERRAGDPPRWNNAMTITKPGAQQVGGGSRGMRSTRQKAPAYRIQWRTSYCTMRRGSRLVCDQGETVLLVAHSNRLRSLVRHLDQLSPLQIVHLNIPTGGFIVYALDNTGACVRHESTRL